MSLWDAKQHGQTHHLPAGGDRLELGSVSNEICSELLYALLLITLNLIYMITPCLF